MKRFFILLAAVAALGLITLTACTEGPADPDIEQGGDNPGDEPSNNPSEDPSDDPDAERPQPTGLSLSVHELVLGVGDRATLTVSVAPSDAAFGADDFSLLDAEGAPSQSVSVAESEVTDDNKLILTLRDRRTTQVEYDLTLYVVYTPTGLRSEALRVSSAEVEYTMPVVRIYTAARRDTITKDTWIDGEIEISGGDAFDGLSQMKTQIKGRGNSTWSYPKKPYALKLDKKQEVLGMPKHKRWCLIANWLDVTHMRNRIACYLGQNTSLAWTPRNEFAEVYFNDEYLGLYQVTEQIKVDENRVDVTELDPSDVADDVVTGGYLLEMDTYFDEAYRFRTKSTNIPVNLKSPDENVPAEQMNYIENYVNEADAAMLALWEGSGTTDKVYEYVDRKSMIDFWIVNEVMTNYETLHPKSLYFHKERGGKLTAGPLWDFDYATLVSSRVKGWCCYGLTRPAGYVEWSWYEHSWWNILLTKDESFRRDVKTRWQELYPFLQSVPSFIDAEKKKIAPAVKRNDDAAWRGYWTPNEDDTLSFDAAVSRLKTNYQSRIEWLNTQISTW